MDIEVIKWAGTLCMTFSAMFVSFSVKAAVDHRSFIGFLFGHILWSIAGIMMADLAVIILNVVFIPIDLWAIYSRYKYTNKEHPSEHK